jgi:hypothetical protein
VIFPTGSALDAGAGIDAPGFDLEDSVADVGFVETTGEDDLARGAGGAGPIEGLTGASVHAGGSAIEEESFGGAGFPGCPGELVIHASGFPDAYAGGVEIRGFIAMELGYVEADAADEVGHAGGRFIHEDADAEDARG